MFNPGNSLAMRSFRGGMNFVDPEKWGSAPTQMPSQDTDSIRRKILLQQVLGPPQQVSSTQEQGVGTVYQPKAIAPQQQNTLNIYDSMNNQDRQALINGIIYGMNGKGGY